MCDSCMQSYPEPLLPCSCSWCETDISRLQNNADSMTSEVNNNDDTVQSDEQ